MNTMYFAIFEEQEKHAEGMLPNFVTCDGCDRDHCALATKIIKAPYGWQRTSTPQKYNADGNDYFEEHMTQLVKSQSVPNLDGVFEIFMAHCPERLK